MKLTKEECLEALDGLVKDHKIASKTVRNKYIIQQLINEHFELVEEHKKLKRMLKTFK